jgi:hypothetical protein
MGQRPSNVNKIELGLPLPLAYLALARAFILLTTISVTFRTCMAPEEAHRWLGEAPRGFAQSRMRYQNLRAGSRRLA